MSRGLFVVVLWVALVSALQGCLPEGGVDPLQQLEDQQEAHNLQQQLPCDVDPRDRDLFYDEIRTLLGLGSPTYHFAQTYHNSFLPCRNAPSVCPGAEILWCVNLYHPTEHIQICLDKNGVVNQTDYAKLLQLECYFRIAPDRECRRWDHCLKITQPEYLLHESAITCTAVNLATNCSSSDFIELNVEVAGQESEKPETTIHNETELVLGETNLFLCTVLFTENTNVNTPDTGNWLVNRVPIENINESPYCFLDRDCIMDTRATTRGNRVRAYQEQLLLPHCPIPFIYYNEWLVIDNATEADAMDTYTCVATAHFTNPFYRIVINSLNMTLSAVLPLLDVHVLEHPLIDNTTNRPTLDITFREGEGFQWVCAVAAGVGDELQWLHNGEAVSSTLVTDRSKDFECSSGKMGRLFVLRRDNDLGGYEHGFNSTLVACNVLSGFYQCQLNRSRGDPVEVWSARVSIIMPRDESGKMNTVSLGLYLGVTVSVILVAVVLVFLFGIGIYVKRKKVKYAANFVLHPVIVEGSVTFPDKMEISHKKKRRVTEELATFEDPLEFPRERLFLTDVVLGEGSFGQVLQAKAEGIVQNSPERNIVAVKTCRENAPQHEFNNLWEELQLMKRMAPHENIVNLLGHCTTPYGPLYLIVEFAIHGSLKDYLHKCKEAVSKLNHVPRIISLRRHHSSLDSGCPILQDKVPLSQQSSVFSDISLSSKTGTSSPNGASTSASSYQYGSGRSRCLTQDSGFSGECGRTDTPMYLTHDYVNSKGLLHMEDVLNFALQIACGLQHLKHLEVVHCDLAARNILISEGFVLKIGDFGMARDITDKQYYRKHKQGRIPVKWVAPEILEESIFTHQSDIWSFGVVLWEILTYGEKPYPEKKISYSLDSFIHYLKEGNRLPHPDGCPADIYDLMLSCWQLSPDARPSPDDLIAFLSKDDELASDPTTPVSLHSPTLFCPVSSLNSTNPS